MIDVLFNGLSNESSINFVLLIVKFTVFVFGVLVCHRLIKRCSASLKHAVLGLGAAGCLALVLLHFWSPAWSVRLPAITSVDSTPNVEVAHPVTQPAIMYACPDDGREKTLLPNQLAGLAKDCDPNQPQPSTDPASSPKSELPFSDVATSPSLKSESWLAGCLSFVSRLNPFNRQLVVSLVLAWAVVASCLLLRLAIAWLWVSLSIKRATRISKAELTRLAPESVRSTIQQRRARVFVSSDCDQMPLGFGLFHKSILLPASCREWDSSQWVSVLQHEIAHFDRWDCWSNLVARIQQALFWFHPLATTLVRKIREESELACDDRVLAAGVSKVDYASVLLQFAANSTSRRASRLVAVSMADSIPLECRMVSILNDGASRRQPSFSSLFGLFVVGTAVLVPLATASVFNDAPSVPIVESTAVVASPIPPQEFAEEQTVFNVSLQPTGDEVSYGGEFLGTMEGSVTLETDDGTKEIQVEDLQRIRKLNNRSDQFEIKTTDDETFVGKFPEDRSLNFEVARSVSGEHGESTLVDSESIFLVTRLESADAIPGTICAGTSKSKLSYHLRVPKDFDESKPRPALFLLPHKGGYSETYIDQFVARWPEIAERYVLVGLNGERPLAKASGPPRYEFTSLSYVGDGTRWGPLPGTDRESPILIAETIAELRDRFQFESVFVAGNGHANFCSGGVNAIHLFSFFPELVDGVIALNAAVLIQCEPRDFKDPEVMKRQRETPLLFLEIGTPESEHRFSDWSYKSYRRCGFPMVNQLKAPMPQETENLNGVIARYPMDQAIEWLEIQTGKDSKLALEHAINYLEKKDYRQAISMLNIVDRQQLEDAALLTQFDTAELSISKLTKSDSIRFQKLLAAKQHGDWFDEFNEFRMQFEFAPLVKSCRESFHELRQQHEQPARDLIKEAVKLAKDQPAGTELAKAKYQEVVEKYFASTQYRIVKERLNPKK